MDVAHRKGDKGHSQNYTYVFYRAKELRKIEAHVCELWSMKKYYEELATSLLSYLLLTEHCLEKIKIIIASKNIQSKLPLYSGRLAITHPCFFSILPVICDYPGVDFSNLKGIKIKTGKSEESLSFDSNGFDERKEFDYSEGNNKRKYYTRFKWEMINEYVLIQRIHYSERFKSCNEAGEWIDIGGVSRNSLRRYELNDEGEIIRFTESAVIKNKEKPVGEVCLIYLPEGGVEIYQYEYVFEDGAPPKSTELIEKRVRQRICFNEKGLITSIDKPFKGSFTPAKRFLYNEDGALERIDISYKGHIEVEEINDDVFFRLFDEYAGDDRIVKKLIFHETMLNEVITYEEDPLSGEERVTHTLFEYNKGLNSRHYFTKQ